MKLSTIDNHRSWFEEHWVVYSNKGKLLGEIQTAHLGFSKSLGVEPTVYIASQHYRNFGVKCCRTLLEAFHYLGVSTKEVDKYYV